MKTRVLHFFNLYGLGKISNNLEPYSYNPQDYIQGDSEKLKVHKDFLRTIESEENARLSIIENKTAQLISQTGLIFSLLSLCVPIFIDKLSNQPNLFKVIFITLLALSFLFYMLTISNALKNYNIKKFNYSKPSPLNVLKYQHETVEKFTITEIRDLLFSVNRNLKINNEKGTNLIHSYNSFRTAMILTALLGITLCFSLFFIKSEKVSNQTISKMKFNSELNCACALTNKKNQINTNHIVVDTLHPVQKKTVMIDTNKIKD